MNIPEGWPTDEMCRGLIDCCNVHLDLSPNTWEARLILSAALSAAPTPPARDEIKSLMVVGHGWNEKYELQSYAITKEFGLTCYLKKSAAPTPPSNSTNGEIAIVAPTPPAIKPCVDPHKSHQCKDCGLVIEQAPTPPESGNWINADDVNRLVRELDVLLNGEDGAAKQASLCDIVSKVADINFREKIRKTTDLHPTPPEVELGGCGNGECNWHGPIDECRMLGSIGPLCPECGDTVEPDFTPSPKAEYSADGEPLNLRAAAMDLVKFVDAGRSGQAAWDYFNGIAENLRKFLGDGKS